MEQQAAKPEREQGTLLGWRVKVAAAYLREKGIRGHEEPELLKNLIDACPSGRTFYFRDLPEVWKALRCEEEN